MLQFLPTVASTITCANAHTRVPSPIRDVSTSAVGCMYMGLTPQRYRTATQPQRLINRLECSDDLQPECAVRPGGLAASDVTYKLPVLDLQRLAGRDLRQPDFSVAQRHLDKLPKVAETLADI